MRRTALSNSPFRTRLFEATDWTPELRLEVADRCYDALDNFGVDDLYRLVFSTRPDPVLLKREKIEAVLGGTTPSQFLAYWVVLHTRGLNHRVATSYHHDLEQERRVKERTASQPGRLFGPNDTL